MGKTRKPRDTMFAIRYAALEAALLRAYRIPDSEQGRFRGRLAALQKGGLLDQQPGKGHALTYGPPDFHRVVFALELTEVGITPAVILKLVADLWDRKLGKIFAEAE